MQSRLCGYAISGALAVSMLGFGNYAFSLPAAADPAPNSSEAAGPALEEVVVTATKRGAEDIQKVPISISAYSGSDLAKFSIQELTQIDMKTPGAIVLYNSASIQPIIRGVTATFPVAGLEGPIAIYLDDVYAQRQTGSTNLVDINQVQVLKGPQGSLYGRNATGGAFLLTTNNPEFNDSGKLVLEGGSLSHYRVDGILNLQLSNEVAGRVAFRHTEQDGYVDNPVTGNHYGGFSNDEVRGKLLFNRDDFSALLTGSYDQSYNTSEIRSGRVPAPLCIACSITGVTPPGPGQTYQRDDGPAFTHEFYGSLRLEQKLGDLTLSSITTGRQAKYHADTDEGNYGGAPPGKAILIEDFCACVEGGTDILEDFKLASHFSGPLNFIAGLDLQYSDENIFSVVQALNAVGGLTVLEANNEVKTYSAAGYAEGYYDVSDTLKLTVGGRYNFDRKNSDSHLGGVLTGTPDYDYAGKYKNFTPHVVLGWSPTNADNYYVSYNTGFKSGGFNFPSFAASPTDILTPEKMYSYETGAKNSFMSGRIRTSAAFFYYIYHDIQVSFVDVARGTVRTNGADARGYGAELDAQVAITQSLQAGVGYSYLNSRYSNYPRAGLFTTDPVTGGIVNTIINLSGTPLPAAPDHTVTGNLTYNFPLTPGWQGSVSAIGRYTTAFDFNPGRGGTLGLDYQRPYAIVNVTGFVAPVSDRFQIGFYVNNVMNRFYLQNANTGVPDAYFGAAPPRTYGGNFTYNF